MASNTTILLKKSGITGNTPAELSYGELSLNYSDGKLFYKNGVGIKYITNQKTFSTINANNTLVLAGSYTDTLSIIPGRNVTINTDPINKTITINAASGYSNANGSIALTVSEIDANSSITNEVVNVTALRFDKDTGFNVSDLGGGEVKVSLGSSWRTWLVSGQDPLIAHGEDTVTFVAGPDMNISTNAYAKTITFTPTNVLAQSAYNSGNNILTYAQSGYAKANAADTLAKSAYDSSNASSAFVQASYNSSNAVGTFSSAGYAQANSADTLAKSAYDQANSANSLAVSAYQTANLKFNTSGGTITGNVTVQGSILPGSNVVYDLGSNTQRWKDLWLSGNTLNLGSGAIKSDSVSGAIALVPSPSPDNPNPVALVFTATGGVITTPTTGGQLAADDVTNAASNSSGTLSSTFIADAANVANSAYNYANTVGTYAAAAYNQANLTQIFAASAYVQANDANTLATAGYNQANLTQTYASAGYNQANLTQTYSTSAYNQANAANSLATSAYNYANTVDSLVIHVETYAQSAYQTANDATLLASATFNKTNAIGTFAESAYSLSNNISVYATSGYNQANSALTLAQSAYNYSNTLIQSSLDAANVIIQNVNTYSYSAYTQANNSNSLAQSAYNSGNTNADNITATNTYAAAGYNQANLTQTFASSGYDQANATDILATSAYSFANGVSTYSTAAYNQANLTQTYAASGYSQANAANNLATSGYNQANSTQVYATSAYNQANLTQTYAQSAYNQANLAETFIVSGYDAANAANSLASSAYNSGNNTLIFAQAGYNQANLTQTYATSAYNTTNAVSTYAQAGYAQANATNTLTQAAYNSGNNTLTYAQASYAQANATDTFAKSAFNYANNIPIQSAYDAANAANTLATSSYSFANGVSIYTNSAYNQANLTQTYATASFAQANAANTLAASAYNQANLTQTYSTSAYGQANSANTLATAGYNQANLTQTYATSAFNQANAANVLATAGYNQANLTQTYATSAYNHANATNVLATAGYNQANLTQTYAASGYASSNTKATVYNTASAPDTAQNNDIWIDPNSGIEYVYVSSNSASQWVEFGPLGTPQNATANLQFSDQTIFATDTNRNIVIQNIGGSGGITLSTPTVTITGNIIANTAGASAQFNNVSSVYFRVNTSTTIANSAAINVVASTGYFTQTPTSAGYALQATGRDGQTARIVVDSASTDGSAYSAFVGRHARGTHQNPTAAQNGDLLARFSGNGYGTTGYGINAGGASIDIIATENYTDTARGTKLSILATNPGTNVRTTVATFDSNNIILTGNVVANASITDTSYFSNIKINNGIIYPVETIAANTTQYIDYANGSLQLIGVTGTTTIVHQNISKGRNYLIIAHNNTGSDQTINLGVPSLNCTATRDKNGKYNAPANSIPIFAGTSASYQFITFGTDLANTYCVITPT